MKYLLDTDICVDLIRKHHPALVEKVIRTGFEKVGLSAITLAELEYGAANSNRSAEAQAALLEFILPFEIPDFNSTAASCYAGIRKELKDKGQMIGDMDMLIASVAMANDLTLVTNNEKEFRRISGLKVENWKS